MEDGTITAGAVKLVPPDVSASPTALTVDFPPSGMIYVVGGSLTFSDHAEPLSLGEHPITGYISHGEAGFTFHPGRASVATGR